MKTSKAIAVGGAIIWVLLYLILPKLAYQTAKGTAEGGGTLQLFSESYSIDGDNNTMIVGDNNRAEPLREETKSENPVALPGAVILLLMVGGMFLLLRFVAMRGNDVGIY